LYSFEDDPLNVNAGGNYPVTARRVFVLSPSGIGYNVEAMDICGGCE
jgi:hypothetical protein